MIGKFDGSKFFLFEANEALQILVEKSFSKDGNVLRLYRLGMKLGPGPRHEKLYSVRDWQLDQVLNESLSIPATLATEFTFNVDLEFRGM